MIKNNNIDFTNGGTSLDWNSEISSKVIFEFIPGEYEFEVIDFQRGTHPGSEKLPTCPKAIIKLRLSYRGSTLDVDKHLFLHSKMEGLLSDFFISIGLMNKGESLEMDWNNIVGKKGRATFHNREASNGKKYFEVKKFLPPNNTSTSKGGF
ncbi:MAG: DUF669 domain-containing protein [Mogibacterium sp.]|nr:DUF669 domain-containing protein [Mogibacterium sp.]